VCAHGSGNNIGTHPVKLNKICLIGLGSHRNKQLAKITDEVQESDRLNPSSHDDLGDRLACTANEISLIADFQNLSLA